MYESLKKDNNIFKIYSFEFFFSKDNKDDDATGDKTSCCELIPAGSLTLRSLQGLHLNIWGIQYVSTTFSKYQ